MRFAVRIVALSVLLLLLFLAGIMLAQSWLQRQHTKLQADAAADKRAQFAAAVSLTAGRPDQGSPAHLDAISDAIGARVHLAANMPPGAPAGMIRVQETIPGAGHESVIIEFPLPQVARLGLLHGQTWGFLLVGALTLMLMFVGLALIFNRRHGRDTRSPWAGSKSEMGSLEQLARTSAAQGTELARERDTRQRMERDLALHQRLQNQALQEKIRLGRDLHDGLIQSLYALGLTIEAVRPIVHRQPDKAEQRLEACTISLNQLIRRVRDYIAGLSEAKLRLTSFTDAVRLFCHELSAGRDVQLEIDVDEEAVAALTPLQTTEALQVIHEAISNALRHGQATHLTVRLHHTDSEAALLIGDNGTGFDPAACRQDGHGLTNMRARAADFGATLRIDSAVDGGTRIVLTFPLTQQP